MIDDANIESAISLLRTWVQADRGRRRFEIGYRGAVEWRHGRWSNGWSVRLYSSRKGGWQRLTYVGGTLLRAAEDALLGYEGRKRGGRSR